MKGIINISEKNRIIFFLLVLSIGVNFFTRGVTIGAFINVIFHFVISWLISCIAIYFQKKSYEKDLQMKLWHKIYAAIIAVSLVGFYLSPEMFA